MCKVGPTGVRRSAVPWFVGMAGATAPWAMALRPAGERGAVPNAASGVLPRVDRVPALHPALRVLEATGGLERAVPSACATAGRPVVVVHPRQGRDLARATGQWANTDAWEARALAHCAAVSRPPPRPLPAAQTQELRALLGRRPPLIGLRPAAQHRWAGTNARRTTDSAAPMPWLHAAIATLDNDLEPLRRASPLWRDNDDLVPRAKGLGPVWARTVRRARPAVGTRTRQQSAAWVGVAPLHCDSGTRRGRRMIGGGRAPVRPVFDMGTRVATRFNPPSNVLYERLRAAGKGKKGALTACMHTLLTRLHALLKQRTPWQPQEVQS
jgi:transposase